MMHLHSEQVTNGITRYQFIMDDELVNRDHAMKYLTSSDEFRTHFIRCLQDCPYHAYRFECPAYSTQTCNQPFEFVLVNWPGFVTRKTDTKTFEPQFATANTDGIASFANLGGDALLIVPAPMSETEIYGHLASFVRRAPQAQVHALWTEVGKYVISGPNDQPIWLNTAGGGVAWLHVRLDSNPKYYTYSGYR